MRNKWIGFGCFLTGINYQILDSCSELSKKRVVRYASALLILSVMWAFTGYQFINHYFEGKWYHCVIGSAIMIIMIIQIERQIILSSKKEILLHGFRFIMALAMAVIGSVIIDQIIFQKDIDRGKMMTMDSEVDRILPGKAKELNNQITDRKLSISSKENERREIAEDLAKHPFIWMVKVDELIDSLGNKTKNIIREQVPNPKSSWIAPIDRDIEMLRNEVNTKDSLSLQLRPQIEADLKANVGFLDELKVMVSLLQESKVAFIAWSVWFIFLLCLELFIVVSKWGEIETDYDKRMTQQMELHFRRI
ncbi:MAG: DUF4407 domain-containing protein [Cyclobacteriaceae bacterium]|nr:DUF4407 domain-containing protein [Cyclobacteriaceae bacterium]